MIRINKTTFYDHILRRFFLTKKPSLPEKQMVCVSEPAACAPGLTNGTRLRAFSYMYKLTED